VALKRTGFGVSEVALSRLCGVRSDVSLPSHMHAAMFASAGFVDDAMRNTVLSVSEPLL